MAIINVTSEIQPLKKVMLHRPGNELLNLTPETLESLLFDDIPYLEGAQKEHDFFAEVMKEHGVEVVYLEDLVAETFDHRPDIRETFLHQFMREGGVQTEEYRQILFEHLNSIADNKEFVLKTMSGTSFKELKKTQKKSLVDYMIPEDAFILAPMPNLYFTRDPFSSAGQGVILNHMYSRTRQRETIYSDYVFKYHPAYKDQLELYYTREEPFSLEGGDILNLNDKTLAIGISQRTQPAAIENLARNIFYRSHSMIEKILAFEIPNCRAFMHLDTVFTQIDVDTFTVHPGILGTLRVFEVSKGDREPELNVLEMSDSLEHILKKYLGTPVDLILCAGGDSVAAAREQWNDGSNTLCIAPGKIIVYDRNTDTNRILKAKGFEVLEIPSGELSRGRGGPRCMSMPLIRES